MREILFRGIDKSSCKWVYGDLLQRDEGRKIKAIMPPYPAKKGIIVKEETIGQYTGLTDKNGTKIFEGDIVRADNGHTGYVIFRSGSFVRECSCHSIASTFYGTYEAVIGNIYDNPELLEESK